MLVLAICAIGLPTILLALITAGGRGDRGDGVRRVELPKCRSHLCRVFILMALVLAAGCALASVDGPLSVLTHGGAAELLRIAGDGPSRIALYAPEVNPLPGGLVLAALLLFQLMRPNTMYSLVVGLLLIALTVVTLAFAAVGVAALGAAISAPPITTVYCVDLVSLFIGMVGFMTLLFRTTMLPRRYKYRPLTSALLPGLMLSVLALIALGVGMAGFRLVALVVQPTFNGSSLLVFLVVPLTFFFFQLGLFCLRPKERRRRPSDPAPPVDVIMAAWNEEELIEQSLRSIQAAGAAYRGTVRVLVGDDGSTDRTAEIARSLNYPGAGASIEVLTGPHWGKARALNRAMAAATADIVVCIDADVQVAPAVFTRLPGWFANPEIGCVGAFDIPNLNLPAWQTKGRLFECLASFGFSRLAYERLDANNIPGTFLAFRRTEALALGGWVEGMNGEDSDMTFNFGRLGLVSVIDPKIVIYEDVPQTIRGFISQRTRWSRASIHIAARHMPNNPRDYSARYAIQMRFVYIKLAALLRAITYFQGAALILSAGRPGSMMLRGLILMSVGFFPPYFLITGLMILYGFKRKIPWLFLLLPFTLVRKVGMLNGILSLPPYRRVPPGGAGQALRAGAREAVLR
jgi:cellulose synthase/poly-beta-1,6-N-acetylglucosamine synthase-like glycosyltransferase